MIRFEGAGKRYGAAVAVDRLDLDVPEGETCALIGPSGCGKSTSLRMVNRLVAPDEGRVLLGGRDVAESDPVRLRRGIGYVLQGVGLFPHRSVAGNVATVPALLGWSRARVSERVDAMLALVGLDPATYRARRPDALSGGERQRVGVARALAADPPVLLMDEPFGAVDPLARGALQREIGALLRSLRKTVLIVTHDIDEALILADRIAVMRGGRLVQAATPEALLARPADAFVAEFVGRERALRRLSLASAGDLAEPGEAPEVPEIAPDTDLRAALSRMLETGATRLRLAGPEPRVLTLEALRGAVNEERAAPGDGPS
ncbi:MULTISPECIES: ABC transporter ATP-binding protein [Methylobacterium]|uniref:Osmoprotectant import ATP-binding protein OsmV n=1 Tax=Methylobacterium jeotgali TaxID=381630 RepID=A0ABQ4T170_9HYPH|nr:MULTISPECIES: ABC transporter ATP-binding protein [Methylobacterium]PIU04115.1 MAG: glycine/betaine ABC transporter [Methylobacterium sp. CG09_land_8_20_14_0_10_71_15]PIU11653.1 MAG: glycine/betaine ABC transporter [Methylobacterium sp. CG08_land_8_20_14_0_20_71_15]GBU17651.1 transporter subunit: ATP-binding component of ABC superfamily [Methylobacterium sp.]GJE08221.1 Osmoprotectant import ATP-binding protein OsmV [Methylobacterium jeotgali]